MAIIVHNITEGGIDYSGINKYQVRINQKVIAEFEHLRTDGLATCLRKAADAVENPSRLEMKYEAELFAALFEIGNNEYRKKDT